MHLINAKEIFEENHGKEDKGLDKIKRNIALLYLKSGKYEEAMIELREVEVSCFYSSNHTIGTRNPAVWRLVASTGKNL